MRPFHRETGGVRTPSRASGSNAIIGDAGVVGVLGALAWVVAAIAAAVAYRDAGAPALAWLLLGCRRVVVSHPPPIGPIGLVFFAAAVALLARSERASGESRWRRLCARQTP